MKNLFAPHWTLILSVLSLLPNPGRGFVSAERVDRRRPVARDRMFADQAIPAPLLSGHLPLSDRGLIAVGHSLSETAAGPLPEPAPALVRTLPSFVKPESWVSHAGNVFRVMSIGNQVRDERQFMIVTGFTYAGNKLVFYVSPETVEGYFHEAADPEGAETSVKSHVSPEPEPELPPAPVPKAKIVRRPVPVQPEWLPDDPVPLELSADVRSALRSALGKANARLTKTLSQSFIDPTDCSRIMIYEEAMGSVFPRAVALALSGWSLARIDGLISRIVSDEVLLDQKSPEQIVALLKRFAGHYFQMSAKMSWIIDQLLRAHQLNAVMDPPRFAGHSPQALMKFLYGAS